MAVRRSVLVAGVHQIERRGRSRFAGDVGLLGGDDSSTAGGQSEAGLGDFGDLTDVCGPGCVQLLPRA
ncbi:MAG: hypothetical protein R2789_13280 [Microthrixaceae bacterium]